MNTHHASAVLPEGLAASIATVNAAALDGDFDDARLCLTQLREKLLAPRLDTLRHAADHLICVLGPAGTAPSGGLGRALVDLTKAFEKV
jgi:hypothetical protein